MAELFAPSSLSATKVERYHEVLTEIQAVLSGKSHLVARMATVAAMLAASFETYLWTGFYTVDPDKPDELVIGPYQGALGCLNRVRTRCLRRGGCGSAHRDRSGR